jgi:hypothetical protein
VRFADDEGLCGPTYEKIIAAQRLLLATCLGSEPGDTLVAVKNGGIEASISAYQALKGVGDQWAIISLETLCSLLTGEWWPIAAAPLYSIFLNRNILNNIMTESSHCFWKCNRNLECRSFFIISGLLKMLGGLGYYLHPPSGGDEVSSMEA